MVIAEAEVTGILNLLYAIKMSKGRIVEAKLSRLVWFAPTYFL